MKLNAETIARIRSGMASEQELRDAGPAEVRAIKGDGGVQQFRFSTKRKPSSLNVDARTIDHVASNEDVDRMGDRIAVKGWDLGNFQKNPLLLWDHDSSQPPIGRVVRARKGKDDSGKAALSTTSRFIDGEINPHAELVFRMVASGDLPAVSVGFNPLEVQVPQTVEEAKELGLGEYGVYFKRQELLELSVVTVPAHAGALAKKLDAIAETTEFSNEIINDVMRVLTGEHHQRVFTVPDTSVSCVIEDDLPPTTSTVTNVQTLGYYGGGVSTGNIPFDAYPLIQPEPVLRALPTIEEIRAAIREERDEIGVDASARMIRSIVRDEITSALRAVENGQDPQDSPQDPPADSGADGEKDSDPDTKSDDLYASVLGGLKQTRSDS